MKKKKKKSEREGYLCLICGVLLNVFLSFHIILLKIKAVKYLEGFYYVFKGVPIIFFIFFSILNYSSCPLITLVQVVKIYGYSVKL